MKKKEIQSTCKDGNTSNLSRLISMLNDLNDAFDNEDSKNVRRLVHGIRAHLKRMTFTQEQGLIIQLISKVVQCRTKTMKMKRTLRRLLH